MAHFPIELAPKFVRMSSEDLPTVAEIEVNSFPSPWSIDVYQREIVTRNGSYWVVRPGIENNQGANEGKSGDKLVENGEELPPIVPVLAYGGMWLLGDDAHVTTIATHPAWRQRRIGEWLLLQMVGEARSHGVSALTLEVRVFNYPALALYEKLGFVAVGLRRGYYQDTGEDARLLTLFAIDHPSVWGKLQARIEEIEAKA
jgi:ribosomal-protein-alanine N-acetyltransferase